MDLLFDAHAFGINSVAPAVIFAILYAPALFWFIRRSFSQRVAVVFSLTFFCLIRFVAFCMRAAIAGSDTAARNINLFIAQQVIYNIGFAGLVLSVYWLALDLELLSGPHSTSTLSKVVRRSSTNLAFRFTLSAGIIVGIVGGSQAFSASADTRKQSTALRIASTSVIFALVVLLAVFVVWIERTTAGRTYDSFNDLANVNRPKPARDTRIGATYSPRILIIIIALLLIREGYLIASLVHTNLFTDEAWWYPFTALSEFLVVLAFLVPGFIPNKKEVYVASNIEMA